LIPRVDAAIIGT